MKQVIIVRRDLKMGVGKLAAQVAHASLAAAEKSKSIDREVYDKWIEEGQAKIILKVYSLDELLSIKKKVDELDLPNVLIHDKGLTQLEKGTVTCLGIGPVSESIIDKITGKLKLL